LILSHETLKPVKNDIGNEDQEDSPVSMDAGATRDGKRENEFVWTESVLQNKCLHFKKNTLLAGHSGSCP
jgi:hypothetical protein